MKNKILIGFTIACLFIIATVNVQFVKNEKSQDVVFLNLEAVATPEWNHWTQWLSQGFTKDEREIEQPCPINQESGGSGSGSVGYNGIHASGSGSGYNHQTNPSGRTDIRCGSGNENCTRVKC